MARLTASALRERPLGGQDRAEGDLASVDRLPQRVGELAVQGTLPAERVAEQVREVRTSLSDWLVQLQSNTRC